MKQRLAKEEKVGRGSNEKSLHPATADRKENERKGSTDCNGTPWATSKKKTESLEKELSSFEEQRTSMSLKTAKGDKAQWGTCKNSA